MPPAYRSLSLPETPEPFLERLGAALDAAYRRTLEGLHAERPVHELATGRLPVEQFDALPEPPSLLALRDQVDRHLPDADLPDLLLEITAKTGFIDGFIHQDEPRARPADLQTSLCAVLVAQGCNVGYSAPASGGLTPSPTTGRSTRSPATASTRP